MNKVTRSIYSNITWIYSNIPHGIFTLKVEFTQINPSLANLTQFSELYSSVSYTSGSPLTTHRNVVRLSPARVGEGGRN